QNRLDSVSPVNSDDNVVDDYKIMDLMGVDEEQYTSESSEDESDSESASEEKANPAAPSENDYEESADEAPGQT
ncbi:hypothetical protein OXX69_013337, partial [Metschnikowia pulcherrima]